MEWLKGGSFSPLSFISGLFLHPDAISQEPTKLSNSTRWQQPPHDLQLDYVIHIKSI